MRVISGQARGHKLIAPEGKSTRPTTDRIKESLFNILSGYLYNCNFLDLFSGSGAIGIEALSRGAKSAVFVDNSNECREVILKNLGHTKLSENAEVIKGDVVSAVNNLGMQNRKFDIIFIDPPYEGGFEKPVLNAIINAGVLAKDGFIVLERASKYSAPEINGLKITREKDYKTTVMTFLSLEE